VVYLGSYRTLCCPDNNVALRVCLFCARIRVLHDLLCSLRQVVVAMVVVVIVAAATVVIIFHTGDFCSGAELHHQNLAICWLPDHSSFLPPNVVVNLQCDR